MKKGGAGAAATIKVGLGALVAVCVLVAYALGGSLGAFVAASALLVAATLSARARAESASSSPKAAEPPSQRRDALPSLGSIEVEISRALGSRRVYDHAMKPRLFRLATTLYAHRHVAASAGSQAARAAVGERLWPLVDPSVKSLDEIPRVSPAEFDEVIARLEALL